MKGHLDAVRLLLDAGADPDAKFNGDDPMTVARDRGHEEVARLLEDVRSRRGRAGPAATDHPIHIAASAGDVVRVRELLDEEPRLVGLSDRAGEHATAPGGRSVGTRGGRSSAGSRRGYPRPPWRRPP